MSNQTDYSFYRTEIRTMQNSCDGDNEKFLHMLANLVGNLSEQVDKLKHDNSMLEEHQIRLMDSNNG